MFSILIDNYMPSNAGIMSELKIRKIYSEDVRAINPATNPTPICTLTAAAAPVGILVLVDVADGTTTADDDDALVVVAMALLAAEVVGAELPATEDEDDSEDRAVAVARIVVLSEADTVAEAVAAAEYALAMLSIAVVSPLR
ncbi:hypothetical protein EIK77_004490 [Talaromyces pinophilus]|nr:hypothetical protein EIK77_004490 [Talaromyces pinophilus]